MCLMEKVIASENLIWENDILDDIQKQHGNYSTFSKDIQTKLDGDVSYNLAETLYYTNLEECLKLALENSSGIKIENEKINYRKWNYYHALTNFLPTCYYTFSIQKLSGEYLVGTIIPVSISEIPITSTFDVEYDVTHKGKAFYESSQTRSLLKSAKYLYNFSKNEVLQNTANAYWDLLGKKLNVEIYRTNYIDRVEQLKQTTIKYKVGSGSKFDVLRAEAQTANAKQLYVTSLNDLRLSQAKLSNIVGIEVLTPVYPSEYEISTKQLVDDKANLEELVKIAIEAREDIKSLKKDIDAMKAQRSQNYTDFFPELILGYRRADVGTARLGLRTNNTLSLTTKINLGENLGMGTLTKIKAQNAQIKQKELELHKHITNIEENILQDYYNSRSAIEKIKSAQKEIVSTNEGVRFAMVRWDIGESTFLDVLQAQNDKVAARRNLINAIVDYNKAQVKLLFDTGMINVNTVLKGYDTKIIKS